jgi:spermidine synthase
MGATIPVMVAGLSDRDKGRVSTVYGVNTLGAVLGASMTELFLIRILGMSQTYFLATGFNLFAALMSASAANRRIESQATHSEPTHDPMPGAGYSRRLPGAMYFAAGYVALGLEVVWLRFLGIVNTNSTVTFSLTLSVYLLAMAVESLVLFPVLRRSLDRKPTEQTGLARRIFRARWVPWQEF